MKTLQTASMFLITLAGCYTTPGMRDRANLLAQDVSTYRDSQAARIERINDQYHQAFARLTDELTSIKTAQLDLDRDVQAQRIADRIIADGNATLRQTFRDAFADAVVSQRAAIAQADLAIAAARDAYSQAYSDAKLKLDEIDRVVSNLRTLAAKEDQQQTALDFIQTVAKIHEELRNQSKKDEKTQAEKDKSTDAAATKK